MFQKIKNLISALWVETDKKKARDIAINLANELLLVMGASENKIKSLKDVYNAALPPAYFNNQKIESWFETHPFFNGPIALKLYDNKQSAFESSFFHLSDTATKARIAATTLLGVNWEDLEIYELPKYKVGIDFFLNYDSNSLLMVISKRGNVRVIEFSERLTHTQEEILSKLSEAKGILSFEGIDLKSGQQIPREPQKTIHEVLWRELQVNEVNKKFYLGISDHFERLNKFIEQTYQKINVKEAQQFSSRLIGRLLFIWFLRKMNLINTKSGYFDIEQLSSTEYYDKKLKILFFDVLNTLVDERHSSDKQTPFLNGGLFEVHRNDFYNQIIRFPDNFFDSLYDHLNSFNFTVDESTPEYEQVAIDPEMLGRVFENLLASIVPETSKVANERKNKGAFYTPREIVSFMCKDALKEYIKSNINDKSLNNGIDILIDLNDARFLELKSTGLANIWGVRTRDVVPKIIEILNNLKILDPACGSGAFPIGMLQLISRTFERLTAKYDTKEKKHISVTGKYLNNRYESKLAIIRNTLYGSDIEPMAIEIARLRSWLSLIVEEKSKIHPLPNLDFNFVCSNSLIDLEEKNSLLDFGGNEKFEEDLSLLKDSYFESHNKVKKTSLRDNFSKLYSKFLGSNVNSDRVDQLLTWNPFDSSKPSKFFDSKTMFNIDKFGIIIANPPYNAKLEKKEVLNYRIKYNTVQKGRVDTAALFLELATKLIHKNGYISYILPYRLISRERNHISFIQFILNKTGIDKIIYLGKDAGFKNVNDEFMIMGFSSFDFNKEVLICNKTNIQEIININYIKFMQKDFIKLNQINVNSSDFNKSLLEKLSRTGIKISTYCEVKDGIVPFIRDKLVSDQKIDERYVPFAGISGTYKLEKYSFQSDVLYLCYDINEAKKYIKNPVELRKVQLRSSSNYDVSEKIITSQNSSILKGALDRNKYFVSNSIHSTLLKKQYEGMVDISLILAFINSYTLNYYHDSLRLKGKDLHPQILISNLKNLPLPDLINIDPILRMEILEIVKSINDKNGVLVDRKNELILELEKLIFRAYSLNNEEIDVIKMYIQKQS
jgi:hypothetical protein